MAESPSAVRARVLISGRVQGVFFRASTRGIAHEFGLAGFVRNLPDGRVEAVFEGGREKVARAVEWCYQGPPGARVTDVEVRWEDPKGESGFRVTF
jgi:acylphosphatase